MRRLKYILSVFVFLGWVSCDKNVVEYNTETISNVAEFQLHYVVPVTAIAANNINRVEINNQLYANATAPLNTYGAIPSGTVGRFYTTNIGQNNIKLYRETAENKTLLYDQNCTLKEGKQNIFVYDFNQPPIIFDNQFPYEKNITEHSDSTSWVKFYNFLYETEGVPTTLKLQYQYQYPMAYDANGNVTLKSQWTNIGTPVLFGETTGWQAVRVNKSVNISAAYAQLDYRIRVIDAAGNDLGDLQVMNANRNMITYSDYWTAYVGRRYHHTMSGMRAAIPVSAVRQFTAL